jgi:apolipoprotein N-acyltransferase
MMHKLLNHSYFRYLVLAIAGGISIFAFAPFNYSLIIIVSLVLLLVVIENCCNKQSSSWMILAYGYIYGFAFFIIQLHWVFYSLYKIIHAGFIVSVVALVGFSLFLATYIMLGVFTYIKLKTRYAAFNYLVLFPSTWVLFEWLRGWFLGGFSWCEIGYTQTNNQFFKGFYPLLGNYGVSWITISLAGVVYIILKNNSLSKIRHDLRIAIIYVVILFLSGYAIKNIQYTKPYGKPIKVALLQGNVSEGTKWSSDDSLKVYEEMVSQAEADLILVPETAISQFEHNLPDGFLEHLTKIARTKKADIVVGIPKLLNETTYVNAAMLLTDPNHPYYAKFHLVPYGEYIPMRWLLKHVYATFSLPMVGFTPGAEYQEPIRAANQKLAFNICYENGFGTELLRSAANSTMMVNLSDMVWYGTAVTKDQHLQLSIVRALENQRYFLQDTNTSITAIIRPDGVIQSSLPIFEKRILTDYVQGRVGLTPFERFGNYIIVTIILIILLIGCLFLRLHRR